MNTLKITLKRSSYCFDVAHAMCDLGAESVKHSGKNSKIVVAVFKDVVAAEAYLKASDAVDTYEVTSS